MKYFGQKTIIFLFLLLIDVLFQNVLADHEDDTWVLPNAWDRSREQMNPANNNNNNINLEGSGAIATKCICNNISAEDAVALVYFRKFVANLFDRKKMQYNDEQKYFDFFMHFTMLAKELELLEKMSDPRDLDMMLMQILNKASRTTKYGKSYSRLTSAKESMGIGALIWDMLKDARQLLNSSEIKFATSVLVAFLMGWVIHRYYGIRIVYLITGGIFILGYFHTYVECNRKLELDYMLEVLERNEKINQQLDTSWFGRLTSLFVRKNTPQEDHMERLKQATKLKLPFCRPDHVIIMYINDLFLKQLEVLIEKCTNTLLSLKQSLPFPLNYMAPILLVCLVAYIFKLTFKYILSPRAWAELLNRRRQSCTGHRTIPAQSIAIGHEDRLSGENLKTLLKIAELSKTSSQVSGVQEVLEALEAPNLKSTSSQTNTPNTSVEETDSSPSKQLNNNETSLNHKSKVILEDISPENINS